jgi:uncharacterized protein (TIGR02598 family)
MKRFLNPASGFSLVEVTLALGVAAFCLIAVLGMLPIGLKTQQASVQQTTANTIISEILADLRADVRLPPGQTSQEQNQGFNLHGHWAQVQLPDTLYFTINGNSQGSAITALSVYRATITYFQPPTPGYTTSVADIIISWPAPVDPATGVPAGKVETFVAVNR